MPVMQTIRVDEESTCQAANTYSRAYLHHLVRAGEGLAAMLLTWNNLAYYQYLMQGMRDAIEAGTFEEFRLKTKADWAKGDLAPL